jgi:hypothetical protein
MANHERFICGNINGGLKTATTGRIRAEVLFFKGAALISEA